MTRSGRRRGRSPRNSREQREAVENHRPRDNRNNGLSGREKGHRGFHESQPTLSIEQSVSDRGRTPVATAPSNNEAEPNNSQARHDLNDGPTSPDGTAKYVHYLAFRKWAKNLNRSASHASNAHADKAGQAAPVVQVDEATLIEERRKKREAIKAKHRGQATPMQLQVLALDNQSAPSTPNAAVL